ncbi:importin alpha-2 subunit [Plasmopara halstedii]|uniref:Importin subunit alpha n=1 Tax=Plasmopara halstedii TaxID=4781 RepID=A0A0P1ANC4_PLAHL|nr:importin alpha-2 subunit [Plasmopara halstedii]CEG42657.1 importin alpha-2 subunit [Plasmopara halstedii]|eukprot:XP_024579026.1 importin alpha-2 subunit [Plasmopara halstedii]
MVTSSFSSSTRIADRMRNFKKGIDADETRRRREDTSIQIRKTLRDERLNQRRRMNFKEDGNDAISMNAEMLNQTIFTVPDESMCSLNAVSISELPKIAAMIHSLDFMEQSNAVSKLRRLLSLESNPPIKEVINLGVVPLLVEFLKQHDRPEMQFEAAWALTNIASATTEDTEVVIRCGAVELLCTLLLSPNEDVCEQAVWALGNIAGDSPQCRDVVLSAGAMMPLLTVLRRSSGKCTLLRNATWTLSNFCRGKPRPDFDLVSPALELLPHLIHSPDEEIISDACWTLSYLSDGNVQAVLDAGVCSRVVDLMGHTRASIQMPALRIVGNIVCGNSQQTQLMLDLAVLPRLVSLLKHDKQSIRREACWTISNITAGSQSQIQEVIDANIIPLLLSVLMLSEFDVRKEAAWAISNATSGGTTEQIKYLVQQGCIPPLIALLNVPDPSVINVSLDALENILQAGEADTSLTDMENRMVLFIEEADGIELIQKLQFHEEQDIYEKAVRIIRDYFDGEDDEELNLTPDKDFSRFEGSETGQFKF